MIGQQSPNGPSWVRGNGNGAMPAMKERLMIMAMLTSQHLRRMKWLLFTLVLGASFGFGSRLFLEPLEFQTLNEYLLPILGLLNGVMAFRDRSGLTAVSNGLAVDCSSQEVWWCRQVVCVLILAILLSLARFLWPVNVEHSLRLFWEVVVFSTVTLSMTSAFWGLAFRNVALVILMSLPTSIVQVIPFLVGVDLGEDQLAIWFLITGWPLPLIWLFATWRHVDDWVRGISIFRRLPRLFVTFLIPSICILAAFAVFRAVEVPAIADRITRESILDSLTEDERATDALYRSTLEKLRLPISDLQIMANGRLAGEYLQSLSQEFEFRADVDESIIDQLVLISLRKQGAIRGEPSEQIMIGGAVVSILCGAAKKSANDGNYPKSWRQLFAAMSSLRHLTRNNDWHGVALAYGVRRKLLTDMWDWALHENVDAESLHGAVGDMAELDRVGCISESAAYQWAYLRAVDWFESGEIAPDVEELGVFGRPPYIQHRWLSRIPWERIRILRMLRYSAEAPHRHDDSFWQSSRKWQRTTFWVNAYFDYLDGGNLEGQERYYTRSEDFRVGFAVLEHNARTGALPASIADLAPEIWKLANVSIDDSNYVVLPNGLFDSFADASNESLELNTALNVSFAMTGSTPCLLHGRTNSYKLDEVIRDARTVEERRELVRFLRLSGLPLSSSPAIGIPFKK